MDIQQLNLDIVSRQFRSTGPAQKGFDTINPLINEGNAKALSRLLRNHQEESISDSNEVNARDQVDYLLDYYSMLEIGLIAGYFPNPLPDEMEKEAISVLSDPQVFAYYGKHYPLLLPQLLKNQIELKKGAAYFEPVASPGADALFERFLMLRNYLRNDADINAFLWFLDDGFEGGYGLKDLWAALADHNSLREGLKEGELHPLNDELWGFIKYVQFLSEFAELIRSSERMPLLKSAFWHQQSYWLSNMKAKLGEMVEQGLQNLRHFFEQQASATESLDREEAVAQFAGIEEDIQYLTNGEHGAPLMEFAQSGLVVR